MDVTAGARATQAVAIAEASAAAEVLPAALPVVALIGLGYCDPDRIARAAAEWDGVAAHLGALAREVRAVRDGVPPERWDAADREAFHREVDRRTAELDRAGRFVAEVGAVLRQATDAYLAWTRLVSAAAETLHARALAVAAARDVPPAAAAAVRAAAGDTAGELDAMLSGAAADLRTALELAGRIVTGGAAVHLTPAE